MIPVLILTYVETCEITISTQFYLETEHKSFFMHQNSKQKNEKKVLISVKLTRRLFYCQLTLCALRAH